MTAYSQGSQKRRDLEQTVEELNSRLLGQGSDFGRRLTEAVDQIEGRAAAREQNLAHVFENAVIGLEDRLTRMVNENVEARLQQIEAERGPSTRTSLPCSSTVTIRHWSQLSRECHRQRTHSPPSPSAMCKISLQPLRLFRGLGFRKAVTKGRKSSA